MALKVVVSLRLNGLFHSCFLCRYQKSLPRCAYAAFIVSPHGRLFAFRFRALSHIFDPVVIFNRSHSNRLTHPPEPRITPRSKHNNLPSSLLFQPPSH